MITLLVNPAPYAGESLSGYILRLSELNGYLRPSNIFTIAGIKYNGPSQLHNVMVDASLQEKISHIIGRPKGNLSGISYRLEESVKEPSFALWRERKMPIFTLRTFRACVCPECLQEKCFARQEWDWALLASCSRHGRLLLDTCPNCKKELSRYRAGVAECVCGFNLCLAETQKVSVDVALFFQSIIDGTSVSVSDADEFLGFWATLAALICVNQELVPNISTFSSLSAELQHQGLKTAMTALQDGNVEVLVGKLAKGRLGHFPHLGPRAALLPFVQYHNKLVGLVDKACLERLIADLGKLFVPGLACQEQLVLDAESVAFILNVSSRVVVSSVKAGALRPVRGPTVDGFGSWIFSADDLAELLAMLNAVQGTKEGPTWTFRDASLPHIGAILQGQGQGHLLALVRAGVVAVVGFKAQAGVPSLLFQTSLPPSVQVSDSFSVKDCADLLEIYTDAVYRIIKAGILKAKKVDGRYRVLKEEYAKFSAQYVFVKELVKSLKVPSTNFAEKLMSAGLKAASGPRIDGGLVYLFFRKDVAEVDVAAIAATVGHATLTGRKPKSESRKNEGTYLQSLTVAEQLGISLQRLSVLVRDGYLKERRPKGCFVNSRFFLASDIRKYLAKFRNNPQLMPVADAATFLNEGVDEFHRKWVRSGRVELLSDGLVEYVETERVAGLRIEFYATVTVREAREILGIDRSTFGNWMKMGKIIPVSGPKIDGTKLYKFSREVLEEIQGKPDAKLEGAG